jgi:hypothetical protein
MHVCLSGFAPRPIEGLAAGLKRELVLAGNGIADAGLKGELIPASKGLVMAGLGCGPGVPITPFTPPAVGFRDLGAGSTRQIDVTFSYKFLACERE